MEKWKKMSYIVAVYLFLIELRPLEPYLTAYQIGPNGNISLSEVGNNDYAFKYVTKRCILIFFNIKSHRTHNMYLIKTFC